MFHWIFRQVLLYNTLFVLEKDFKLNNKESKMSSEENETFKKYSSVLVSNLDKSDGDNDAGITIININPKSNRSIYEADEDNEGIKPDNSSTILHHQEESSVAHYIRNAFKQSSNDILASPILNEELNSRDITMVEIGQEQSKLEKEVEKYKKWHLGFPPGEDESNVQGDVKPAAKTENNTATDYVSDLLNGQVDNAIDQTVPGPLSLSVASIDTPSAIPRSPDQGMNVLRGSSNPFGNTYAMTTPLGVYPVIEIIRGSKYLRSLRRKTVVLSGFNMNVYNNKLYCLVGPRKCGKTTVCRIVIGRWQLDRGNLKLFEKPYHRCNPEAIGYMPEENKLQLQFTIRETFIYFGNLFRIPHRIVEERLMQYASIFELPSTKITLKKMRDHEIRAVSFALALLHQPRLLVLDEPTAGVDPVLRHIIWQHLHVLLRQGSVSVLVTSHDMAEAPYCDAVGLMHKGSMLAEGSPQDVVRAFGASHLRDVVFLYETRKSGQNSNNKVPSEIKPEVSEPESSMKDVVSVGFMTNNPNLVQESQSYSEDTSKSCCLRWCPQRRQIMSRNTWLITCRSLKSISRNFFRVLLILFLPPLYLILFGLTVGLIPQNLNLAVVNHEGDCSHMKAELRETKLSCNMLKYLKQSSAVHITFYKDMENAEIAFRMDNIKGILIYVPTISTEIEELSEEELITEPSSTKSTETTKPTKVTETTTTIAKSVTEPIIDVHEEPDYKDPYDTYDNYYDNEYPRSLNLREPVFSNAEIVLVVDNSNILVRNVIVDAVTNAHRHLLSDHARKSGQKMPVVVLKSVHKRTSNFRSRGILVWGGVVAYAFAMGSIISAATMADDDELDVNDRLIAAGISRFEMYQAHFLCWFLVISTQSLIMMLVGAFLFLESITLTDVWLFLSAWLIILLIILCGISFGFFIYCLVQDKVCAVKIVLYFLCPLLLLSGILWPVECLSPWLRKIVIFGPINTAAEAMNVILIRWQGTLFKQICMGILSPMFFTTGFIILGSLALTQYD